MAVLGCDDGPGYPPKAETMLNESEWNDRYDQGELEKVQASEEQLETLLSEHRQSIGYGPAGQERN